MNRRAFLTVAAGAAGLNMGAQTVSIPINDTHVHLYDPGRPQGVPWPEKDDVLLYRPTLTERYRQITKGLGIVGAIAVECSPWLEDNQWVLDLAAKDTLVVGMVGNLDPGNPDFRRHLERFHRNPLFRGIRYGNLWGRNLGEQLSRPDFVSGLTGLAEADLELDTANPDPALVLAIVHLTDQIPRLRVVIDHLPQLEPPVDSRALREYQANLRELANRPQVYVKLSEVLRRVAGQVPSDLNFYRSRLDELWNMFGQDRLIYGSDWPNSDHWGTYPQVLNVVREYFSGKGPVALEKFFWKNSVAAYRWAKRDAGQP